MKKFISLIFVFAALVPFASALSINSPSSVPENASWGFSVSLDPTDTWQKASVKIDDSVLLDVYSNGTIVLDPFKGQFVLKAFVYDEDTKSNGGLVLYVSHFGLQKADHTIFISSDSTQDSKIVKVFSPLDESFVSDLDGRITTLEDISALEKQENARLDGSISQVHARIESVEQKISDENIAWRAKISSLESWLSAIDTDQNKSETAAVLEEQSEQKAKLGGFFTLISNMAMPVVLGFIILLAIIAIAVGLFVTKNKFASKGIYSKDEYNLPVSKEDGEMADALSTDGKWAKK
ncbi:MAG TPA: hypothetical protein VJG83_03580 [archaeon]|nr:hypothetical protein [archaeon]